MPDSPDFVMGVDPGLNGGLSCISTETGQAWSIRMPKESGQVDLDQVHNWIEHTGRVHTYIEKAQPFGRDGKKSAYTQFKNYGMLLRELQWCSDKVIEVPIPTWKNYTLSAWDEKDKDAAISFVEDTFPDIDLYPGRCKKPHDGMADALCIAWYGLWKEGVFDQETV